MVTKIILFDDRSIFTEGIKALVECQSDMELIGTASTGVEALSLARNVLPDMVILDITMPDLPGHDIARDLREAVPGVRLLVLTLHEDRSYLQLLFETGVSGYLAKQSVGNDLLHAIRTVVRGGLYLDPLLIERVLGRMEKKRIPPDAAVTGASLSERETAVLKLIARGHSSKEISVNLKISARTVETYRARVMKKLDLQTRVDIVRYAIQQGWLEEAV